MTRPRSITYVEYNADMSTPLSVARLRARCCLLLLVSPAVNAVLAVLILFASVLSGSTVLWFVGLIAALTFLNGLIPWPRGAGFDGSMGWWLWRWFVRLNDSAQETALSMLWLLLALNYGARPGQVHDRWTELAAGKTAEPRSSVDAHGSLFAYFCALDRSDAVLAEACIRRAITWTSSTEPRLRQLIVIEAAFLAARYLDDVVTAERFLAEEIASVDASLADNLWRAKGAIHLGRGQFEEALAYSAAALEPVPISVSPDLMLLRRAQGTGDRGLCRLSSGPGAVDSGDSTSRAVGRSLRLLKCSELELQPRILHLHGGETGLLEGNATRLLEICATSPS